MVEVLVGARGRQRETLWKRGKSEDVPSRRKEKE